jgi:uncharacterized integral membrane protein
MKRLPLILIVLSLFITSAFVLAKGDFDYLAVKGPGITGEINITNPALTGNFFVFANFTQGEVPVPGDPGQGYQVVRVYVETVDGKPSPMPFDQLHYYPYTGYVYYDGIINGSSEYDDKWYAANPSAEAPFRAALAERARLTWIPFVVLIVIIGVFFIAYNGKPKRAHADN